MKFIISTHLSKIPVSKNETGIFIRNHTISYIDIAPVTNWR